MMAQQESMPWALQTALQRVWADPARRRRLLRLVFGSSGAVLALRSLLGGLCRSPAEYLRLLTRVGVTFCSTLALFVARGGKPKFARWTLQFELCSACLRVVADETSQRVVGDAELQHVLHQQTGALGFMLGWLACFQTGRRLVPETVGELKHVWIRSPSLRKRSAPQLVVLYVPGGGPIVSSPRFYARFGVLLAAAIEEELQAKSNDAQTDVFLVDCHKTADSSYSEQVNAVLAAYQHILQHEGLQPSQIVLGGDSTGARIAMLVLLRLREVDPCRLPLAAMLLSPVVDLAEVKTPALDCIVSSKLLEALRTSSQLNETGSATWASASPMHCNLRDLPPVFVQTGGLDYVHQQAVKFVAKARADGADNWELDVHEDVPHVFSIFPKAILPHAAVGLQRMAAFAVSHISGKSPCIAASSASDEETECSSGGSDDELETGDDDVSWDETTPNAALSALQLLESLC